jgi:hypothetical protein
MKDIKIQTNGKGNIDVLTHALNSGYSLDIDHEPYLLKATYIFLSEHKDIKWSDSESIFNDEDSEEMTPAHFMEYRG